MKRTYEKILELIEIMDQISQRMSYVSFLQYLLRWRFFTCTAWLSARFDCYEVFKSIKELIEKFRHALIQFADHFDNLQLFRLQYTLTLSI